MARKAKTPEQPTLFELAERKAQAPEAKTCEECGHGMTAFKGRLICSWAKCPTKKIGKAVKVTRKAASVKSPADKPRKPVKPAPAPEPQDDTLAKRPTLDAKGKPVVDSGALPVAVKLTREDWLHAVINGYFRELFKRNGSKLPEKIRVSCGWPSSRAMSAKKRVLGQCWSPKASEDAHTEIFLSPILGDSMTAVDTLAHELVHAAVGTEAGHGPVFRALALKIGLEGKMTSAGAGEALKAEMKEWLSANMPAYPHAKLDMDQRKKQTTRLIKVFCSNVECSFLEDQETEKPRPYSVRMSQTVLDAGAPKCGCCGKRMVTEGEE